MIEDWYLKITKVDNGYLLEGNSDEVWSPFYPVGPQNEPHQGNKLVEVIEEDERDELKVHECLLWRIMDYFAFGGSKHDKERIRIKRESRND